MSDYNSNVDRILDEIARVSQQMGKPMSRSTLDKMLSRAECDNEGHKYQVTGKFTPTKIACSRCESSWTIGFRTAGAR